MRRRSRCLRPLQDVRLYEPSENDLYLVRDILDKQIIDTDGVRVVRVNDLELARVNGHFFVVNVDIGGLGLMRRLGLARPTEKVAGRLGRKLAQQHPVGCVERRKEKRGSAERNGG